MRKLTAWLHYIRTDAIRSPLRSALIVGFSMLSVLAIAFLQHTIRQNQEQVDNLFEQTVIHGHVIHHEQWNVLNPTMPSMGVFINQRTVDAFADSGYLRSLYLETAESRNRLLPVDADATGVFQEVMRMGDTDLMLAVSDLGEFISRNTVSTATHEGADGWFFADADIVINFAEGFSQADFAFAHGQPIPIIVHEWILARRGLAVGDTAQLVSRRAEPHDVVIIGSYIIGGAMPAAVFGSDGNAPLIIMHLDGFASFATQIVYNTMEFTILPDFNREIPAVRDYLLTHTMRIHAGRFIPILYVFDDEIRLVLAPLEQTLGLLTMLYPIALIVIALLSLGLPVLLLLQRSKNAAIYRAIGTTKTAIRAAFAGGYAVLCLIGIIPASLVAHFALAGVDTRLLMHGTLPVACAVIGAVAGAVIISGRPVLELLQTKE